MNHIVDLANSCDYHVSLWSLSGQAVQVGRIVDLLGAHINTNLFVAGTVQSGPLQLYVQTSDSTTSGSFTDPTSGLPTGAFPVQGRIVSGGIFYANSGLYASGYSSPDFNLGTGGGPLTSGGFALASFQRPHRYARVVLQSGNAVGAASIIAAGFIGQKVQGVSGGGYTLSPGSGTINV